MSRKYEQAIDDFTEGYGISRSAVSRQMVEATRGALQKLCERRIDELGPLAVLMIDGKQLHGECVVIALGVDLQGKKHTLGLMQGATENSVVVQQLLDDLIDRGLDATRGMLIVLDGSKALRKAVRQTFGDRSPVQRCQIHKRRNVKELLPKEYQRSVDQPHAHGLWGEGLRAGPGAIREDPQRGSKISTPQRQPLCVRDWKRR